MKPTNTLADHACLIVHGPDHAGLVKEIAALIERHGGNIVTLGQYSDDPEGGNFFQRVVFHRQDMTASLPEIKEDLANTLGPRGMKWQLADQSVPKRMAILASKSDYCLLDLLWRQQRGLLPVTISMVISNHMEIADSVRPFGIPFIHVPSRGDDKSEAELQILESLAGNVDFVVLARYMQILSPQFLTEVGVPVINIHHSFLPAFIGADPYRQAKVRGVKLIGATAHYVTEDLDEGPIIEQDTARVTHAMSLTDIRARGAIVERTVLSRAVRWHAEDKVIRHENQTIILE